jgi:hypothetical protein
MEMENVYASLISGLFATMLSVIVTVVINIFFHRRYEEKSFYETRMKLNEIMLNEPFLRTDDILKEFLTGDTKQDYIILKKYDLFCMMIFNYLKSLCDSYGYNKKKIFIKKYNFEQNLDSYKEWWKNNKAKNIERYQEKFVKFIDDYYNYNIGTQR